MDFEQLMNECQHQLDIEHFTPKEDGEFVIEFDGWLDVRIRQFDRSTVLLHSVIGREPDDPLEARSFVKNVLRRALVHYRQLREVVSMKPGSREIHLFRYVGLESLTPWIWQETLEVFVNRTEQWTNFLKDAQSPSAWPLPMTMLTP